jgi:hypothetical protein
MSETVVFTVGAIVFAITVYGTVLAGGMAMTRIEIEDRDYGKEKADGEDPEKRFPLGEY